jgi:heme a synthase
MATKPRAVFQDVTEAERPAVTPGGIDGGRTDRRGAIRLWLLALFALVVLPLFWPI